MVTTLRRNDRRRFHLLKRGLRSGAAHRGYWFSSAAAIELGNLRSVDPAGTTHPIGRAQIIDDG